MNLARSVIRIASLGLLLVCVIAADSNLAGMLAQAQDISTLQRRANNQDAEAQYQLAGAYLNGTGGVSRDPKQGIDWLRKAAESKHPAAQNALWVMYRKGFPPEIPKDPRQGLQWLQKSAVNGYPTAQYNLAVLYRDGDGEAGISQNPREAATWFRKAARQPGSDKSQAALLEMLQKKLISQREADWRAPQATNNSEKAKAAPFSLADVETGLKGWITNNRMAFLVQKFGVDFKLNTTTRKRLVDAGAQDNLLTAISNSRRS